MSNSSPISCWFWMFVIYYSTRQALSHETNTASDCHLKYYFHINHFHKAECRKNLTTFSRKHLAISIFGGAEWRRHFPYPVLCVISVHRDSAADDGIVGGTKIAPRPNESIPVISSRIWRRRNCHGDDQVVNLWNTGWMAKINSYCNYFITFILRLFKTGNTVV